MTDRTATRPRLDGLLAGIEIHVDADFFNGDPGYFVRTRAGAKHSDSDMFGTEAGELAASIFAARQHTTRATDDNERAPWNYDRHLDEEANR